MLFPGEIKNNNNDDDDDNKKKKMKMSAYRSQKRASDSLELKLQMVVSYHMDARN